MIIKHAIMISVITGAIICGAITAIVGGALGMSATATVIHYIMDDGPKGHKL
jgi:hypothetical protein